MPIKPIKKIGLVKQSGVTLDDLLQQAAITSLSPTELKQTNTNLALVNRKLAWNGKDVGQLIKETAEQNPALLSKIASELEKFRKEAPAQRRRGLFGMAKQYAFSDEELSLILGLCDAYMAKVGEYIKRRFDETQDGLSVLFDEQGQLVLNGINIHTLVKQGKKNPNPKACLFLKGIRSRLQAVLQNKSNSNNFDRIRDVVMDLIAQIDEIVEG